MESINNKQSLAKNFLWNSAGSFVYLICQWSLMLIAARISTDSNVGALSLSISITAIFFNIACFNIRPYLVSDEKKKYTDQEYISFRIITMILSVILCIGYVMFFNYTFDQFLCIMIYLIYRLGDAIVDLMHSFEQRSFRMDIGGKSLLIRGIAIVLIFYFALKFTNSINMSLFLVAVGNTVLILLYDFPQVRKFVKFIPHFTFKVMKTMLVEFLPLTIAAVLTAVVASYPRQVLEAMEGTAILGIYATVASPAVIIQVAANYVFNPLLTTFSNYLTIGDYQGFRKLVRKTCVILAVFSFCCIVGSIFLGEWGLSILYGANSVYVEHSYLLVPIMVYFSINAFALFFWNLLIVFRSLKQLLIINGIGFIITLLISQTMIEMFYMDGVTFVIIIYAVIIFIAMLALLIVKIKEHENNFLN